MREIGPIPRPLLSYKTSVKCALLPVCKTIYQEVNRVLEPLRKRLQDLFASADRPDHIASLESLILTKRLNMRVIFNSGIRAALFLLCELPESMKALVTNIVVLETGLDQSPRYEHRTNEDAMFDALGEEICTFQNLETLGLEISYDEGEGSYNPYSLLRTGRELLERKQIHALYLLFWPRLPDKRSVAWQCWFDDLFRLARDGSSLESSSSIDSVSLKPVVAEIEPWASAHGQPWFEGGRGVTQLMRVTRRGATYKG